MAIGSETPRYYPATDGIDKKYPSVTTIESVLDKPALIPWAVKTVIDTAVSKLTPHTKYSVTEIKKILQSSKYAYKKECEAACNIGTTAHDAVEKFLRSLMDNKEAEKHAENLEAIIATMIDEEANAFSAFIDWYNKHTPQVVALETAIEGIGYGGRLDAVMILDGRVTLVDFKTSKGFYDQYPMQLAAYVYAYNAKAKKLGEPQITNCVVLRLDKRDGKWELRDYSAQFNKSLAEFMCLASFWSIHREEDYALALKQFDLLQRVSNI
jgi:ATP-dependent exoDNAse (exonuclease V) beta subunit